MRLRTGQPTDYAAILALDPLAKKRRTRTSLIRHALDRGRVVVCVDGLRAIGYGVLEYWFYGNGFVSLLYVRAGRRRQGVGLRLMRGLEDRCRTRKMFTSTNLSNVAMQALLARRGFQLVGMIDKLDPGDPELVYFKLVRRGARSKARQSSAAR